MTVTSELVTVTSAARYGRAAVVQIPCGEVSRGARTSILPTPGPEGTVAPAQTAAAGIGGNRDPFAFTGLLETTNMIIAGGRFGRRTDTAWIWDIQQMGFTTC